MELTQKEKAEALEQAVINCSAEELSKIYDKLGYVEMSAPALGLACRFRGLDIVKTLVDKGATFDFPSTEEIEKIYRCYIGQKYANYRTNYSLYLLKVFRGKLKGACCLKGMKFTKNVKQEVGKPLSFLADEERITVLNYLIAQKGKISFQPEEMLFYAIFAKDKVIYEELRKQGVTLSDRRIHAVTEGGIASDGYWYEFGALTGKLADEDYLEVMQQLALELHGKPFYYTQKMFDITKKRFYDLNLFEYFLAHFRQDKMKKYQMICNLIDKDVLDALPVIERIGWLSVPKKRDEIIEYASKNKKTEALAWLLDYKNRTADFAAEQEKAEKKMMRELNRNISPNSVEALRKIWGYKKREDGTLIITKYKGSNAEVIIPEKIGRNIVTAIGYSVFSDSSALKEIRIPKSVVKIGSNAFRGCSALGSITIPEGVQEIEMATFANCHSLKTIIIPGTVKKVREFAFTDCSQLEKVYLCEGVLEIGARVFEKCSRLETVVMPQTIQSLAIDIKQCSSKECQRCNKYYTCTERYHYGVAFPRNSKLVIYCPKGSYTEGFCKENGFQFKYIDDRELDCKNEFRIFKDEK